MSKFFSKSYSSLNTERTPNINCVVHEEELFIRVNMNIIEFIIEFSF